MSADDLPQTKGYENALDVIDREILKWIERRATEMVTISQVEGAAQAEMSGKLSKVDRLAAAHRIDQLVKRVHSDDGLISREAKSAILKHVENVCLRSIVSTRVAVLGPEFSYSHLAAIKYFGRGMDFELLTSIPAVFEAVSRGEVSFGIVPIENSTDGGIVDTLGMFIQRPLDICGEVVLPIHHTLLSRWPRATIQEIHSKPQALSQCRAYLAAHYPSARLVETASTTAAARTASEQLGVAAVASVEAGMRYELDVLAECIEDNRYNVTRFAVLGKHQPAPTGDDKTTILFQVNHKPGALADVMAIFKANSLNLTWIESFPSPFARNEYLFFVELAGHRDQDAVASALEELKTQAERLEILGSYPKGILTN